MQGLRSNISVLSEGVDVYSDWIDACEAVAENPEPKEKQPRDSYRGTAASSKDKAGHTHPDDHYEDDFVVDDEAGMEGNYTGEGAGAGDEDDE